MALVDLQLTLIIKVIDPDPGVVATSSRDKLPGVDVQSHRRHVMGRLDALDQLPRCGLEKVDALAGGSANDSSIRRRLARTHQFLNRVLVDAVAATHIPPPEALVICRGDDRIVVCPDARLDGALVGAGTDLYRGVRAVDIVKPQLLLLASGRNVRSRGREGRGPNNVVVGERLQALSRKSIPNLCRKVGRRSHGKVRIIGKASLPNGALVSNKGTDPADLLDAVQTFDISACLPISRNAVSEHRISILACRYQVVFIVLNDG